MADWLSRALARSGLLPAREVEQAIRDGRVRLAGKVVRQPLTPIGPDADLRLDGRPVSLEAEPLVVMMHKPAGVITSRHEPGGAPTVFEVLERALPVALRRYAWHALGRLDRDTTGLLLFTNDERVVGHVTDPATKLPKRYRARVGAAVDDARLEPLRRGLELDGQSLRPVEAHTVEDRVVELVLTEGKFHQVKRMLGAIGLPVLALHRRAIGELELDLASPGAVRLLTAEEIRDKLRYAARPR